MPLLVWALVRIGGLERGWPLVQVIAYTPYALIATLLSLLTAVLLRRWLPVVFLVIATLVFILAVGPRGFGTPTSVGHGRPVRILALNLHRGQADPRELLALAASRDVDLLVLTELTTGAIAGLEKAGIEPLYPETVLEPGPRGVGAGIWSRWPLAGLERLETRPAQFITAVQVPDSIPLNLVAVHPTAPTGPRSTPEWRRDLQALPAAGSRELPLVLAGDFNATLDHARLRDLIDTGYEDAAAAVGRGLSFTWPSRIGWPPPVTIDHVLAQGGIRVSDFDVEPVTGTDHRAVFAELVLPPVATRD
ncbi:MAG: endonuclease/exonuclease/phosphatase family protein [Solirubrobacterales bacterium]|nr:endonuclease/exonuclease/phosphatase family protein [Solirubrobacterales bacterium]